MFKHYTMNQVVLPLDLEVKLQENDIAYAVNNVVENIPIEAFDFFGDTRLSSLSFKNMEVYHIKVIHSNRIL
ncbi:hypothetical protein [Ornithinibacillus sp. FSL M8-0202]|uniref:hypothetical protein n=1 Tax=Ornithinibacillus sp. FSL M8-0202 TaxID=2921616 RepID=UPI0030D2E59C